MHPARANLPALGEFLRARRAQLKPEQFGLPAGQRRRTPGLRREEAAMLCGISPTWLTWIEQGRITSVSVPTLAAIARGLKLSDAERSYLFGIAARRDPAPPRTANAADAPALRALVDAIHAPAYLLDRHWDVREFNTQAGALFGDWLGSRRRAGPRPGLLQYVFLDPRARRFIDQWESRARRLVAEYRADTANWRDDPVRQQRVAQLRAASSEFAAAWDAQQVLEREGGRRVFRHPVRGRCAYTQTTLRVAQQPDLKLVVLLPA